jgi:Holliday junction resolvase RusA-like endonuclease
MKIRAFEIPGPPLLIQPVPAITIQHEGFEKITGPVTVHITAWIQIPPFESHENQIRMQAGQIKATCGPDILAVAFRIVSALQEAGVIRETNQVISLIMDKAYSFRPCIDIVVVAAD